MPTFPAAYCKTCNQWLSPQGSEKKAFESASEHQRNRKKFDGVTHTTVVYESREDMEENR